MTAKAAVVGWPIEHSLSPVLHGHWLREYGIDGSYEKIAIEPGTFAQRIAELRAQGYRGVNITVPYKEEAFALANDVEYSAEAVGAVNLLVFMGGDRIVGRNTDSTGLAESLRENISSLHGSTVILLGAGGAARGALLALETLGVKTVHVLNRDRTRAESLCASLAARIKPVLKPGGLSDWKAVAAQGDLLINSTSAGMSANPPLDIDLGALPKPAAVCDIVYKPLETALLKDARARGHQTIDGLGMLMHQAAPSFEAFFGTRPEVTPALRAALIEALQARG